MDFIGGGGEGGGGADRGDKAAVVMGVESFTTGEAMRYKMNIFPVCE